jgi:hypothetical protein
VNVTQEGFVFASTEFSAEFPAHLAVDGSFATSWFSAGSVGEGSDTSVFQWLGQRDDRIFEVAVFSNADHANPDFRTGFGFQAVTLQIFNLDGEAVYQETRSLPGTPDPDLFFNLASANVTGSDIVLVFSGHEAPDCGGFAELEVYALR